MPPYPVTPSLHRVVLADGVPEPPPAGQLVEGHLTVQGGTARWRGLTLLFDHLEDGARVYIRHQEDGDVLYCRAVVWDIHMERLAHYLAAERDRKRLMEARRAELREQAQKLGAEGRAALPSGECSAPGFVILTQHEDLITRRSHLWMPGKARTECGVSVHGVVTGEPPVEGGVEPDCPACLAELRRLRRWTQRAS